MKTTLLTLSVLILGLEAFSQGNIQPNHLQPPPEPTPICDMVPSRNNFEWIESVSIGEMINPTGKSTTRSDEYDMSIGQNFEAGAQLPVLLIPGYKGRPYEEFWRIWIDLNNDNNYSENEIVFEKKGKGSVSGSITIPEGGNGNSKVKVAMNWKYFPSCTSHANGEIEYYSINIAPTIVSTADFNLPATIPIISVIDALSSLDIQGVADNSANQLTIDIPYTNGEGLYSAFTGEYVVNSAGSGNDDNNSFRITYPAGEFDNTGSIPVTIEIDGDENFDAKQVAIAAQEAVASLDFKVNGQSKGNIELVILGGIPDRNFADANHKFIYLPVTAPDGKIWLNNNLGANYSNISSSSFNPLQTASTFNDYNAYGSLFQWGRYSDGHELINRTGTNSYTFVNPDTNLISTTETPEHSKFIRSGHFTTSGVPLWSGVDGVNNPCPLGYRIPNEEDITSLSNYETSDIIIQSLTNAGVRNYANNPSLLTNSSTGYYLGINSTNNTPFSMYINSGNRWTEPSNWSGYGMSVRCIKD